ncbi:MAG: ABC transporter permease [Silvanigrellaceae bacterium]
MSSSLLNVASALWQRDMLRFRNERSRWLGLVSQPLMFWFLIGFGLNNVVSIPNSGTTYLQFFFCGSLVMCVLFTTLFGAISLIEDAQTGFLRAILISPAPRAGIALGKIAGLVTMVCVQIVILMFFSPLAGISPTQIHWPMFIAAVVLGSSVLAGINLGAALLINSVQGYHAVMGLILFPLWIVSGSMFPIPDSGLWSWLGGLNPMTHTTALFHAGILGTVETSRQFIHLIVLVAQLAVAIWFTTAMTESRKARHV